MKFLLKILIFSILLLTSIADEDIIDVVSSTIETTIESGTSAVWTTTELSGASKTEASGAHTTEASGAPNTEASGAPKTEASSAPNTEPSGAPNTEPSGAPNTEPSGAPNTEPSGAPNTEPSGAPNTEPSGAPNTEPSGAPNTEPSGAPNTEPSGAPNTEPSGVTSVAPQTKEHLQTTEAATADPYMDFNFTCENELCTYKLSGPQTGPAEISIVNEGSELWPNASAETYQLQQNFSILSEDIKNFLNGLNDTYNNLEGEISGIEGQIILNNKTLNQVATNIANLSAVLKSFSVTTCYYQTCMIVTKPPTTTTTPTRPTTTSVCASVDCDGVFCDKYYNGSCTPSGGIASCQCIGNLNPKRNCKLAGCGSGVNYMKLQPDGTAPFWSNNYNSCMADSDMATQPSYDKNIDCTWKLDLTSQNLRININPTNTTVTPNFPEGKFSVTTPQRTQPYIINPTADPCILRKLLYVAVNRESPSWVTIRFQSTNNVPATGAYFDWTILSVDSTPAPLTC